MAIEAITRLLAEDGPWVMLVFYLLWRDAQKDAAMRASLEKNSEILVELTTLIRERLGRRGE